MTILPLHSYSSILTWVFNLGVDMSFVIHVGPNTLTVNKHVNVRYWEVMEEEKMTNLPLHRISVRALRLRNGHGIHVGHFQIWWMRIQIKKDHNLHWFKDFLLEGLVLEIIIHPCINLNLNLNLNLNPKFNLNLNLNFNSNLKCNHNWKMISNHLKTFWISIPISNSDLTPNCTRNGFLVLRDSGTQEKKERHLVRIRHRWKKWRWLVHG